MKKLVYINILLAVLFASCDPMEDIYDKIDQEKPLLNVQQLDYTLTDDDYDEIGGDVAKYGNFSSSVPAADYLPAFFLTKYATLDEGSSVYATYKYFSFPDVDSTGAYVIGDDIDNEYQMMGQSYNNFSDNDVAKASISKLINSYGEYSLKAKTKDIELTVKYVFYSSNDTRYIKVNDDWSTKVLNSEPDEYYELDSADYRLLGQGKYYNFSYIDNAESYISSFAQMTEGKGAGNYSCIVHTNNYDKYIVLISDGSEWSLLENVTDNSVQYVLKESGWIPDPTVNYGMKSADYQTIVDYVGTNVDVSYLDSYKTAENYYGTSAYYNEFRINDGYFEKNEFTSWEEAVSSAIKSALLPSLYPDAVDQIDGIEVHYIISFDTYTSSMVTHTMEFKCTKSGPNPEFEYIEGSEALK